MNSELKALLESQNTCDVKGFYAENVNEDALSNKWLDTGTGYIWTVAALAVIDPNKCDWVYLYIGHLRSPTAKPEYIGCLHWRSGENDDIGRCLRRYLEIAEFIHPVFEAD